MIYLYYYYYNNNKFQFVLSQGTYDIVLIIVTILVLSHPIEYWWTVATKTIYNVNDFDYDL